MLKHRLQRSSLMLMALSAMTLTGGCGSDDDTSSTVDTRKKMDGLLISRVDDQTGFVVGFDSQSDSNVSNSNGIELLSPDSGVFVHQQKIYITESRKGDKVHRYRLENNRFIKEAELFTGENTRPGSLFFVNNQKAYINTYRTAELLVVDLNSFTITKRIDLSSYALGKNDTNPEPSSGVVRDGKFYLALAQLNNLQEVKCQAGASLLIMDATSDAIEKHIQDNRTCSSGDLEPNNGLILDAAGDIYVPHVAGYGYYPNTNAGFLRIKQGADEFDPDYYFSISDLTLENVPGKKSSYVYKSVYHHTNNKLYANLFIPGLTSNPPDYVNDKNYVLFELDLPQQKAVQINVPDTAGWAADLKIFDSKVLMGRLTSAGRGLFWYDPGSGTTTADQAPDITTEGDPYFLVNF